MKILLLVLPAAVLLLMLAVALGRCHVGYPFRGPGYDPALGVDPKFHGRPLLVIVTQGNMRNGARGQFFEQLRIVMDSMNRSDGLVGYAVRKQLLGSRVWTLSVWTDAESARRFTRSPAHQAAVAAGGIPRETFLSAYFQTSADKLPITWHQATEAIGNQNRTKE